MQWQSWYMNLGFRAHPLTLLVCFYSIVEGSGRDIIQKHAWALRILQARTPNFQTEQKSILRCIWPIQEEIPDVSDVGGSSPNNPAWFHYSETKIDQTPFKGQSLQPVFNSLFNMNRQPRNTRPLRTASNEKDQNNEINNWKRQLRERKKRRFMQREKTSRKKTIINIFRDIEKYFNHKMKIGC